MKSVPERLNGASPDELLEIASFMDRILVFESWSPLRDGDYCRRSPRDMSDPKARVWHSEPGKFSDESFCQKVGWYWEIGFGVMGLSRVANWSLPHDTKEDAMKAVDDILRQNPTIVLCGAVPDSEGGE